MRFFNFLTVCFLLILVACNSNQNQEPAVNEDMAELSQTDSWESNQGTLDWDRAWNNNDLEELKGMTADDAVLLLSSEVRTGQGINSWFETNAPVMQNLVTNAEISNEGENMAYEAGTYTHGVKGMDEEFSGVYTIVWEMTNNEWKIKLMDMTQRENRTATR